MRVLGYTTMGQMEVWPQHDHQSWNGKKAARMCLKAHKLSSWPFQVTLANQTRYN